MRAPGSVTVSRSCRRSRFLSATERQAATAFHLDAETCAAEFEQFQTCEVIVGCGHARLSWCSFLVLFLSLSSHPMRLCSCRSEPVQVIADRDYVLRAHLDGQEAEDEFVHVRAVLSAEQRAAGEPRPTVLVVQWFESTGNVDAASGLPTFRLAPKAKYAEIVSPLSILRPCSMQHSCGAACQPSSTGQGFEHAAGGLFLRNDYVYNVLQL